MREKRGWRHISRISLQEGTVRKEHRAFKASISPINVRRGSAWWQDRVSAGVPNHPRRRPRHGCLFLLWKFGSAFVPGSNWYVYRTCGDRYRVTQRAGRRHCLHPSMDNRQFCWRPDHRHMAVNSRDGPPACRASLSTIRFIERHSVIVWCAQLILQCSIGRDRLHDRWRRRCALRIGSSRCDFGLGARYDSLSRRAQ